MKNRLEDIGEEPRSVRDILIEMKNISERIVDLAFSSVMFDSEDIAREVLRLEKRVDELLTMLRMKVLMAAETVEDARKLLPILSVAVSIDEITNAAGDLAKILLKGFKLHPIILESLKMVDEVVVKIDVKPLSPLIGKTLGQIPYEFNVDFTPLVLCRGGKTIINPGEDTRLRENDYIIVKTTALGAEILSRIGGGSV
ncbi:MAG: PhoU domain-containing protein [Candidatus Methanomethylicia archaeon]